MFFKSLPFQLVLCISFALIFGNILPLEVVQGVFTLSNIFKEILLAFLPFVIFSYISTAILSLDKKAPILIFAIISFVILSNIIAVCTSFGAARVLLPLIQSAVEPLCMNDTATLSPYFILNIPQLISADKMMLLALGFGLVFSIFKNEKIIRLSNAFQKIVTKILLKGLIPFLPFYILGFVLKMNYEGGLAIIFKNYGGVFIIICGVMVTYIALVYAVGQGFHLKRTLTVLRNMVPAGITGFSTMSSAVTMPVTLTCTEKNIQDKDYARLVIPTTVNIHMMGDALSVPLLTFGVMQLFGQPLPSLEQFMLFVPAFCMAKFSLAAIPGGTIIVMLPVLQAHFNLSPEAASLITTLYILQDPLFTAGNVMGNGAFAVISHKFLRKFTLKLSPHSSFV